MHKRIVRRSIGCITAYSATDYIIERTELLASVEESGLGLA